MVSKVEVELYSASSKHASDVLPLPVRRHWSLLASPYSQAPAPHCKTTDTDWCITRCASVYSPSFRRVLISAYLQRLRLSRPGCLVLRRGSLPISRVSRVMQHTNGCRLTRHEIWTNGHVGHSSDTVCSMALTISAVTICQMLFSIDKRYNKWKISR